MNPTHEQNVLLMQDVVNKAYKADAMIVISLAVTKDGRVMIFEEGHQSKEAVIMAVETALAKLRGTANNSSIILPYA